ncbi:MAG: peptidoglycan-binding protein [Coleofasciculus sp. G3-WIS-01]|uniref:peptidoglycan-binding protein n=1 Tax=Coleofasciculus sp. G3-WIS-01 TaxID=3069528 RepID=UPI003304C4C1
MATNLETFKSPRFTGEVIQADIEFFDSLQKIDRFAANNGLEIFVTQSVRQQGVPIGGAIVPPASRSNHLVGHAIDMNILLNGRLFNSTVLRASNLRNLPVAIQNFIRNIQNDPILRWGGDFGDPVHIDDGLNVRQPATWRAKFPIIQAELLGVLPPDDPERERLLFLTRPFMRGEDVRAVQKALIQREFDIDADGIFGSLTDAAVTAFQASKGLTPDGRVGTQTRQALGL